MKDNGLLDNLFRWSVDCKCMKLLRLVTRVKQGTAACCLKLSVLRRGRFCKNVILAKEGLDTLVDCTANLMEPWFSI